jgi:hypothetical protein
MFLSFLSKEKRLELISGVNATLDHEGWLTFNVTKPFVDWMVFPDTNFGLYLDIYMPGGIILIYDPFINS